MDMNLMPIPQNYKNNVDWVLKAYDNAGVTFPDGFQKDAIQNAVGAKKNKKYKGWGCDISYVENDHGKYLIVEDFGTVGLTGNNTPVDEVNQMMARGEKLPEEERLSSFTSMFNSVSSSSGPGLYGAGKSVYSVASETYTYFFDSLREDGKYVANVNKCGQVNSVAFEDDEAKTFILDNTGLDEKTTTGTRIIIVSPKEELLKSIQSGDIISFIQESWWRIIRRLDISDGITVNGTHVEVPDDIMEGATHIYELPKPELYSTGYKVKHFGLYVFENGKNKWSGISYYRKGMKIGEIDIKDIPPKLEGKYWGYIEVDEEWEEYLSEIEDAVHFGVSKGQKRTITYRYLKNYCDSKVNELLIEWGYIKDKENADQKLREELQLIAEDIQDLFDKLGYEDLGQGAKKADFDVRWQNITYPTDGSECVTSGDKISFSFRITSTYATSKKFEYKLSVTNPKTGSVISQIANGEVTIESKAVFKENFVLVVNKDNSEQYAENRIVLVVKAIGSGKERRKELPYFYDTEKPDNNRDIVDLTLHECTFPTLGSRRVNFGEALKNVCYRIENKRNQPLNYKLDVYISDPNQSNAQIDFVKSFEGVVDPFEEEITPYIDEIVFDQETFGQYMEVGVLELRGKLASNVSDDQYEKGDKIAIYGYKIFLNMDEKNGKHDSFDVESTPQPDNYKRSWYTAGNGRKITLNVGHAAYLNLENDHEIQHEYLREQMMKQFVLLYLAEGKYDMFNSLGINFTELEPQEAADRVFDTIEQIYYQSLL